MSVSKFHPLILAVLLSGAVSAVPAVAAEADQFTGRFDAPLEDSSAAINRRLNQLLREAVDRANEFERSWRGRKDPRKREWRLYHEMRKDFHHHIRSDFMRELIDQEPEDDGIDRRRTLKEDSIFAGWRIRDGYLLGTKNADKSRLAFSPQIRVGEVTIGVDKLEHIFNRGWLCFDGKYRKGNSDAQVFYLTRLSEKLIFGGNRFATGVYSYADLVGNFNGMRFWNDVLQKHDDILGREENVGPYVINVGGVWKVNPEKSIDMTNYVDWGMDEGINCSRYATRATVRRVRRALARLGEADPEHHYGAPMEPDKFEQLKEKYGEHSEWLLNTEGVSRRGLFFKH